MPKEFFCHFFFTTFRQSEITRPNSENEVQPSNPSRSLHSTCIYLWFRSIFLAFSWEILSIYRSTFNMQIEYSLLIWENLIEIDSLFLAGHRKLITFFSFGEKFEAKSEKGANAIFQKLLLSLHVSLFIFGTSKVFSGSVTFDSYDFPRFFRLFFRTKIKFPDFFYRIGKYRGKFLLSSANAKHLTFHEINFQANILFPCFWSSTRWPVLKVSGPRILIHSCFFLQCCFSIISNMKWLIHICISTPKKLFFICKWDTERAFIRQKIGKSTNPKYVHVFFHSFWQ